MGKKLSPPDLELYQRTDEVLHYVWDPIGVFDAPKARDEYLTYLPQVFRLLKENASADDITEYLSEVEANAMGLGDRNKERCIKASRLLLEWKQAISDKYSLD